MRKFMLLLGAVSLLSLSVPVDLSFAISSTKKQAVQGKAKQSKKAYTKKKKYKYAKAKKKVAYKKPRYASNINQPSEGELLKLEGMIKDLNEQ
ncbi:MAG: hypothetical protein RMI50_02820 [Aquificaceae bacterium]|nr:hypothetical protein [Aquificaceae bacterium]